MKEHLILLTACFLFIINGFAQDPWRKRLGIYNRKRKG
jgi:hypothetical protein